MLHIIINYKLCVVQNVHKTCQFVCTIDRHILPLLQKTRQSAKERLWCKNTKYYPLKVLKVDLKALSSCRGVNLNKNFPYMWEEGPVEFHPQFDPFTYTVSLHGIYLLTEACIYMNIYVHI